MRVFVFFICLCFCIPALNAEPTISKVGKTTITANTLEYDYKRAIAIFKGNVEVDDAQVNIKGDEMRVFFDGTNSIKAVTALGNVKIKQVDKTATCSKAIYTAADGQIVMTGKVLLTNAGDTIDGDRIIIWTNEERMICEPARLIIHPSAKNGKGETAKPLFPTKKKKEPSRTEPVKNE